MRYGIFGLAAIGLCLGALSACSGAALLNTITPSGAYRLDKNIEYGSLKRQKFDIYHAKTPIANAPTIMFVHGGGWNSGDKDMYKFVGEAFADAGYTVVIPSYRIYPKVKYPAFVDDTAMAVAKAYAHLGDNPLVLVGHSAGAYNAAMVAVNEDYLSAQGVKACDAVAGLVGLAGPYGLFKLTDEPYITIFPDRQQGDDAPVKYVDGQEPPAFFAIGYDDKTVTHEQQEGFAAKIREMGGKAIDKRYKNLNHIDVVKVLSRYFDGDSPLKDDMIAFIEGLPTGSRC